MAAALLGSRGTKEDVDGSGGGGSSSPRDHEPIDRKAFVKKGKRKSQSLSTTLEW